ncbi:YtxH domain-containing protein [uncultured Algibacter sp.]|uniref:YtxH domain-containing protein n=1 Tax=uncultured Algibacter sp. TaxID=298659 RepID=UPI00260F7FF9|nr:YtxH domain-containing protein [uncultured Algibacter sp.]
MSDEKNLSDDLNDMLGDAKDRAKKAADKASEIADDAKEKAKEFASEAKESASEFAQDAKEVLSDGKNVAIIAHITIIGWVIALVMNNSDKTDLGSFYIRQMLGLLILSFVLWFIPVVGWILILVMIILWIMSLVGALSGEKKLTPVLGEHFQNWFKAL